MQEMERRIALLRLLLADITARERQAHEAQEQLRGQITRIVDFTVRQNAGVGHALSAMAEVEERLGQQDVTLRHLALLRARAQGELQALLVTRGVADARARLGELEERRSGLLAQHPQPATASEAAATPAPAAAELAEIDAEIAELRTLIQQASEAAARSLTMGPAEIPPEIAGREPRKGS
jgi:hypothetical protein